MRRVKLWLRVVCLVGLALACQPSGGEQSVNPAAPVRDSGGEQTESTDNASPTSGQNVVDSSFIEGVPTVADPSVFDAGKRPAVDAGPPRVIYWGLQPGTPSLDAGVEQHALARLEVMALGSRIMTHVSPGLQDAFEPIVRSPDLNWIVTLPYEALVATEDAAIAAWIDRVWQLGPSIRFLILGQRLETNLFGLQTSEREAIVTRLEAALLYAGGHADKPAGASVGVGLVTLADVPRALLSASNVVALSYSAVEDSGDVTPPDAAFAQLRSRVDQLADFRLPVVLQDLAYPSSSSEADQLAFFSDIKAWFSGSDAPDVRAVVVSSLNPPASSECADWADEWRVEDGADVRCSVGMRDAVGQSKPALNEVVDLLAEFAQL